MNIIGRKTDCDRFLSEHEGTSFLAFGTTDGIYVTKVENREQTKS